MKDEVGAERAPARAASPSVPPAAPAPPWRSVPRRPRPLRRALSRDAVVDAALQLLSKGGGEKLTMRRVAAKLGTAAASLYGYVADKEELTQLVVDRIFGEIPPPNPDALDWQEELKAFMRNTQAAMVRHPGSAALTFGRIPIGPNFLVRMEALLGLLRAAGLTDTACAYAGDVLGMFIGVSAHEREIYDRAGEGGDIPHPESQVDTMRNWIASLPADQFPNTMALAGPLFSGDWEERFEWGMDLFVRGLASHRRLETESRRKPQSRKAGSGRTDTSP